MPNDRVVYRWSYSQELFYASEYVSISAVSRQTFVFVEESHKEIHETGLNSIKQLQIDNNTMDDSARCQWNASVICTSK